MAKTPLLLVTNVGLQAAMQASPKGPFINLVHYKIGSAYGYTPTRDDTGINGALLVEGNIDTYQYVGDNTADIIVRIPANAGPFDFGEVAIYATSDASQPLDQSKWFLFAKAVFDQPQKKYSSLGTNVGSTYTFHCLIKLQQSVAIFKIVDANMYPAILQVNCWSDVIPQSQSANPEVKLLQVLEPGPIGARDTSILAQESDMWWDISSASYAKYGNGRSGFGVQIQSASSTWIRLPSNAFHPQDLQSANRNWVVRIANTGDMRSVKSIQDVGNGQYQFNLNTANEGGFNNQPLTAIPPAGSFVHIYRSDQPYGRIYYDTIIDPPPPPARSTPGNPGLAAPGSGLTIDPDRGNGYMAAYGLLHDPSQNTGRFLNGNDNLYNLGFPSGLYTYDADQRGALGAPVGLPPGTEGISCHLMNVMPERGRGTGGGSATQWWYPLGGTDQPAMWRTCLFGNWGPWTAFVSPGRQGYPQPPTTVTGVSVINGLFQGLRYTAPTRQMWATSIHDRGGSGNLRIRLVRGDGQFNGIVADNTRGGGKGYGRWNNESGLLNGGDTLIFEIYQDWSDSYMVLYSF